MSMHPQESALPKDSAEELSSSGEALQERSTPGLFISRGFDGWRQACFKNMRCDLSGDLASDQKGKSIASSKDEALLNQRASMKRCEEEGTLSSWNRSLEAALRNADLPIQKSARYRHLPLIQLAKYQLPDMTASPLGARMELGISVTPSLSDEESLTLRLDEGYFDERSAPELPEGVYALGESAEQVYGQFISARARDIFSSEKDFFALVSYASSPQGLFLYIADGTTVDMPIEIFELISQQESSGGRLIPSKLRIVVGREASVNLIWRVEASNSLCQPAESLEDLYGGLIDLTLLEGAQAHLVMDTAAIDRLVSVRAALHRNAQLKCFDVSSSSSIARHDYHARLVGEGSEVTFESARLLNGSQLQVHHVYAEHIAPACRSSQNFRAVAGGESINRFSGKIYVHPQAQKTDAYQICKSLLLDDRAQAVSEPNLEIFADDVKASHGATTGQLNEEMLFYLRARGLSRSHARRLMIEGFIGDVYDSLQSCRALQKREQLRRWLEAEQAIS